jgi:superfamily II DNA/RNA helicase
MHPLPNLQTVLANCSISALLPLQEQALTAFSKAGDIRIQSPTGTGKTLAYLLPLLQIIETNQPGVQCLVMAPSRELVLQIVQVWKQMNTGVKCVGCYGGHTFQTEVDQLREMPVLLVGTPGRLADHLKRGNLTLTQVQIILVDEFDKCLDEGFEEEMKTIFSYLPPVVKKVFVSATHQTPIPAFAAVQQLQVVSGSESADALPVETYIVKSKAKDKIDALFTLLCSLKKEQAIVFCNHREAVDRTVTLLHEKGIDAAFLHGGMEQTEREQAMVRFSNGTLAFMIATDLASRGLDMPTLQNVIHYHIPTSEEAWIHRNGRTARMNRGGTVYLLLHTSETLPEYVQDIPEEKELLATYPLPPKSKWETLFINGGRKDKISKVDIVGFLHHQAQLKKDQVGIVIVKDHSSFVAVHRAVIREMLPKVKNARIKGVKYTVAVAR